MPSEAERREQIYPTLEEWMQAARIPFTPQQLDAVKSFIVMNYLPTAALSPASVSANYMRLMPGGTCFAHGPYTEMQCPKWPACITDPQNPSFVNLAKIPFRQQQQPRNILRDFAAWWDQPIFREGLDERQVAYLAFCLGADWGGSAAPPTDASIEEAVRVVDTMTCSYCQQKLTKGPAIDLTPYDHVTYVQGERTYLRCTAQGRAILDAILPILRSGK